ncbi:transcription antiterminator LicT [Companilactobacillus sp. RD055328]|uniref:PRD domain-containing protein n=1 Tax=Companilactobacillus sp. RD055328 TaxID=2916634 RepID=UPI001FC8E141|nr:PRD domain-containing protein [Companilactobacillus sp. RD055328]GKQ42366.1 transcription antiterminator LicT [Companilactobacillus sp. RD055328]
MRIESVVNNNVVMTIDDEDNELILVGKGLGFQAKKKDLVDESKIQKTFYLKDKDVASKFKSILNEVSTEELLVADEIIHNAENILNKKLNESIYISLSDHIHYSLKRYRDGESLTNAFVWDTKRYYPKEFAIGMQAVELINERFDINMSEDEAVFISFNFINANTNLKNSVDVEKLTAMVKQIVSIVSYSLKVQIDTTDINGYRFINHVKYFAQRIQGNIKENKDDEEDNELYTIIRSKYQIACEITEKINKFLVSEYQYDMSKNDKLYFMIHIHKLMTEK